MSSRSVQNASGVTIDKLSLSFGQTQVLKDVTLEIRPGELFTFLGPSGSGKSTLLRAIAGFGPEPGGRILVGGADITHLPPWRRNVGMVFQSYALWPHMSVRKNVSFGLEEQKVPASEIHTRTEAALNLVGLLDLAERRPSQLSGGQQQRVALARTIVVEPRVLLLDEPLSNLDANLRVQMRREILELQRKLGLTTIFVTHDQEEANTISDRIAVLNDGVIQQVGTPLELYDRPINRFVANFLGTANLIDGELKKTGGKTVFTAPGGITVPVAGAGLEPGQRCTAMFRPQSLRLSARRLPARKDMAALEGKIDHREFLGNLVRYAVRTGDYLLLVDEIHQSGEATYNPGDNVVVSVNGANARIFRA
ncbi:MAG: ABC transporter ATP-binding protein [Proteobacteria bacterium]|nr:ABC transporter ATP-binding protein [Pseudomonadota bacterium]